MTISKKIIIIVIVLITLLLLFVSLNKRNNFNVTAQISNYELSNPKIKDGYMEYLKKQIKLQKLIHFIENDYVALSPMSKTATGKDVIKAMEFVGYKMLFISMFDKTRKNFDDCPVTENFTNKFKTNLLEHFDLIESEDCESNCLLDRDKQEIKVEVYGNFKNTEPTYWTNHYFDYTLDDEGNVDNVIFNYTEK